MEKFIIKSNMIKKQKKSRKKDRVLPFLRIFDILLKNIWR